MSRAELSSIKAVQEFVTVTMNGQCFGIPLYAVQEVSTTQKLTPVPLAPAEVMGVSNVRGRMVTMVDTCIKLGLPPLPDRETWKSVVVEHKGHCYGLMVEAAGEMLTLPWAELTDTPGSMAPKLKAVSSGVFLLKDQTLIVLDVERLLEGEVL